MFNKKRIAMIKESYPVGTRLRLNSSMNGENGMPTGSEGTVRMVDDIGSIHMAWDNGRTLALIPGEDSFSKIPQQEQDMDGPQMNM